MEAADLLPLLEQLDDNIDDLEEILQPVLDGSGVKSSSNLPVLDKAKFHVLVTYTLESLIFSWLRLHGVNAKEHPVFRELTRVKQYFEKIKELETGPEQRTLKLDKEAASRFIKHGLAGNDKIDLERKEREAKERARAQLKASLLAKKDSSTSDPPTKNVTDDSEYESDAESDDADEKPAPTTRKSKKKQANEDKNRTKDKQRKKLNKEERKEVKKDRRKKKGDMRKAKNLK
ncbi:Sas10/Utp3/C1D family protein [Aspergillus fijiensis CBS 313.89]|uniref:Exosome complex protein n=1 Tax=Aspergillus fijiensis CBS 313.89 TaxID=1448319 RepID=A0A8G1RP04_9EURO|nr:exosome-associated protein [Aspergillus fijiensis CBS 313.89]RAK76689.1 exosome-associated protein [Aspergillus fijiensis CBS 313.89]